ncbi:adenine phosphoribosyltransferase [Patescibacteria group bacterium]|nr:adenine phosphoribosyltransferase [Patescibacteria group bacterium]
MKKTKKVNGKDCFEVYICGIRRNLPLFEVVPGVRIAIFNLLGETELIRKAAKALVGKLPAKIDAVVTPEVKSVPLAYEMACILNIPYVVIRKIKKPYMMDSLSEEVLSITTGKPQTIWLDGRDKSLIEGKNVILVDDVVSTGSTLLGLRKLMRSVEAKIVAEAAIFTEGDEEKWKDIISLGNLPVFLDKKPKKR